MAQETETLLFEVVLDVPGVQAKAEQTRVAIARLRAEKQATEKEFKEKKVGAEEYGKSIQAIDTQLIKAQSDLKGYQKQLSDSDKIQKAATGSAVQMRAQLSQLVSAYDNLSKSERENEAVGGALQKSIVDLNTTILDLEVSTNRSQRNVGNYGNTFKSTSEKIANATAVGKEYVRGLNVMGVNVGQANDAFKAGTSGLGTFTKAIFTGRGALIALGAVPIVLILTGLVALLTKTQAGMDFVARATGAVSAVFSTLTTAGVKLGQAFIEVFTSPTKAIQAFKEILMDLPGDVADAASAGYQVVAVNQQIRESERAITVERAKNRAEIERLKKISEDTSKSQEEREAAARSAYNLENKTLGSLIQLQQQRIDNTKAELQLGQQTAEDKDKLAEAEIRLAEIQEESLGKQTELQNQLNQIALEGTQQRLAKELAATDEQIASLQKVGGSAEKVSENLLALQEKRLKQQFELDAAGLTENNQKRKALEIKLQADIAQLQYDGVIAYAELLDRVDNDNLQTRLVNARKGSAEELELQKQQIDQQLAADTAAATRTIKIKEELDARLALLDAKALADKEAIDKQIRDTIRKGLQDEVDIRLANSREGSRAELQARLDTLGLQQEAEIDAADGEEKAIAAIRARYRRSEKDLIKQFTDQRVDEIKGQIQEGISGISNIFQALSAAQEDLINQQQSEALKSAGLSAEAREKIQTKFDEKRAVAEKKAAEQRRRIAEAEAVVNMAGAIIKASPNPFLMALAAFTGLAQIAVIEAQKFEYGGEIVNGPSHANGGVTYRVGKRMVELEGGEGVINKRSMAIPGVREKASELNQLGGGVAFAGTSATRRYSPRRLEYGGIINVGSAGSEGGIDYSQMRRILVDAVQSLPPQYVRVGEIRDGIGKQVRVENKANINA